MLAERGFDPRTSGLWAQHASTAPLCFRWLAEIISKASLLRTPLPTESERSCATKVTLERRSRLLAQPRLPVALQSRK